MDSFSLSLGLAFCLLPVLLRFFIFVFEFLVIIFQLWYSAID